MPTNTTSRNPARRAEKPTPKAKPEAVTPTPEPETPAEAPKKERTMSDPVTPPAEIKVISPEEFGKLPVRLSKASSKWEPFFEALAGKPAGTAVGVGTYEDEDGQRRLRNSLTSCRQVEAGEFKVKARNGEVYLVVAAEG